MKHKRTGRTLGRTAAGREQLLRNLTASLLQKGSLVTTSAKAKELRVYFERLISDARGEVTLAKRRRLLRKIKKGDLAQLLEVAKAQSKRPGGYLRLTRLPKTRSDGAEESRVDILYD